MLCSALTGALDLLQVLFRYQACRLLDQVPFAQAAQADKIRNLVVTPAHEPPVFRTADDRTNREMADTEVYGQTCASAGFTVNGIL